MEFVFSQEDQMSSKGKLPNFSYSSSSSPSSSSPPQRKISSQLVVPLGQIYHDNHHQNQQHHHQFGGSWLSNRYHPAAEEEDTSRINETSTAGTTTASSSAAAKLDLMDVNDVEEDGNNMKAAESGCNLVVIEKEHMFDKVVTPSDVGKLNRLVIPKQHAERYFPLDSTTNEKGLLLNFEDRNGKSWRFRYSYWNSSQSYVMTKGWSRFVKEKKLDAGDIVSFQRGLGELGKDRLYIDWRRRPDAVPDYGTGASHNHGHHGHFSSIPWSPLLMRPTTVPVVLPRDHLHLSNPNYRSNAYYNVAGGGGSGSSYGYGYGNYSNNNHPYSSSAGSSVVYLRSSTPVAPQQVGMGMVQWQFGGGGGGATGGVVEPMVYESVPVVQGKAAAKRLRLFGVNMDCPITPDHQSDHDQFDKVISSTTTTKLPHNSTSITLQQLPSPQLDSQPQFRVYRGTPLPAAMPSSTTQFLRKGKSSSSSSSMSLDLEI